LTLVAAYAGGLVTMPALPKSDARKIRLTAKGKTLRLKRTFGVGALGHAIDLVNLCCDMGLLLFPR
jgi:hypothetical protein